MRPQSQVKIAQAPYALLSSVTSFAISLGASGFNYPVVFYGCSALLQIFDEILIRLKHLRRSFGYFGEGVCLPIPLVRAKPNRGPQWRCGEDDRG